jgi:hypothetical protein
MNEAQAEMHNLATALCDAIDRQRVKGMRTLLCSTAYRDATVTERAIMILRFTDSTFRYVPRETP